MSTINEREQMWESLQDPDHRKQLIDEHINVGIAFQIHGLRKRQEITQKQLAEKLGEKKQPLISSWENPNYGKYTLGTLKDLAKAFDVGLLVRFVPFSTLVDWTVDLTSEKIAPPSFSEEKAYALTSNVDEARTSNATSGLYLDANTISCGYEIRIMPTSSPSTATAEISEIKEPIYA